MLYLSASTCIFDKFPLKRQRFWFFLENSGCWGFDLPLELLKRPKLCCILDPHKKSNSQSSSKGNHGLVVFYAKTSLKESFWLEDPVPAALPQTLGKEMLSLTKSFVRTFCHAGESLQCCLRSIFGHLPMLAQSDLICVATTISMKSPSMYRNLSFIEHFFRVEDWRDRCLWHQSFNFFLCFFNIPVYLEKSFIFKAVFKSLHNLSGFYWPWAFSWLRFSLFLHLHQRWGVGSASATLREIHRVIISLFLRLVASLWPTWQWYQ